MAKEYEFNYDKKIKSKKGFSYNVWMPLAKLVISLQSKKVEFYGSENIPKEGGFIMSPNHISNFDPITIGANGVRDLHFMTKSEHFEHWYTRHIISFFNGFPVKRGAVDRSAIDYAIRVVDEGHVLCVFPEGTRSKTKERPEKGKPGVAMIAKQAKADVMPVSVRRIPINDKQFKTVVRFGEIIKYEDLGFTQEGKTSEVRVATRIIMERIGDLWDMGDAK